MGTEKIGFGGGCHWCTEAVFQALAGVANTDQGFVTSRPPHDSFSEAVIVTFDPAHIPLAVLVEIHLRTHASDSQHALRGKYRSAIYTFGDTQQAEATTLLADIARRWNTPLVTKVLAFAEFRASDLRFHNYYAAGPERPFCRTYIDPKLALLRTEYGAHIRSENNPHQV